MHIVLLYRKQNFDLIQSVKLLAAHNFTAFTLLLCKSNYEGRKKNASSVDFCSTKKCQ